MRNGLRRLASWRLALAALAVEAGLFLLTTRRFVVEGRSMLPALKPGDRVVVSIFSYRVRRPRVGEIAVIRPAGGAGRLDIKRISAGPGERVSLLGREASLGPDEWSVQGDNTSESTDSRQLGPVRRGDLVGPVWFSY